MKKSDYPISFQKYYRSRQQFLEELLNIDRSKTSWSEKDLFFLFIFLNQSITESVNKIKLLVKNKSFIKSQHSYLDHVLFSSSLLFKQKNLYSHMN